MKNTKLSVGKMVRLAVLVAIILVMAYTPLGYLKIGVVSMTLLMIPVAVASVVVGPVGGAIAGGVFGLTSFLQCFGADLFGTTLFGISPVLTFIMCMVPRIIAGWLPGLIFKAISKFKWDKTVAAAAASLSATLLNTILFVGALILFFGNSEYIRSFGDNMWAIIGLLIGLNAIIEIFINAIVGTAVSRALIHFIPVKTKPLPEN